MDKQNNNSKCKQCQKCPPSQTATRHCKPIHNRECGCPPGTYHDKEVLICLECLKCNVGYGAVSPCTNISNTECQPCREVRVTRLDNLSIVIQLFCFLRRRWTFTGNSALLPSDSSFFYNLAHELRLFTRKSLISTLRQKASQQLTYIGQTFS